MNDKLFSTGEVLKLIPSVKPVTFGCWCRDGIIEAASGGEGTGNHRVFTLMQVVGICAAVAVRDSDQGCKLSYIKSIVLVFSLMTEKELIRGRKKDHKGYGDVWATYNYVLRSIKQEKRNSK